MGNINLLDELKNVKEDFKKSYIGARKDAQLKYIQQEKDAALQEVQILDKLLSLVKEDNELHIKHEFNELYAMAADALYFENKLIVAS